MTPRRRLFTKYFALIVALVSGALIASSTISLYFSYQESQRALTALQREKAVAAAYRIDQYIRAIEHEIGWTTLPRAIETMSLTDQRRIEYLKLLRQAPAITEVAWIDREGPRAHNPAVGAAVGGAGDPMISRRAFLGSLGLGVLAAPFAAVAQQAAKIPRVGFLCARSGPSSHTVAFLHGLRELGYVEGKNLLIEWRFAPEGRRDPFPDLAAELVRLKVDLIVVASLPAIRPTKEATTSIPIIMAQSDDPVGAGFVTSLARPRGNITGLSFMTPELSGKQLELLKAAVPRMSRVAVLSDINDRFAGRQLDAVRRAAGTLGVKLQPLPIRGAPKDFDRAFAAMRGERAEGLVVLPDVMFFDHQERLVTLAAKSRLPVVYGEREFADAGGLMAYGPNYDDLFRRSAYYVDRILKGAKPADLPVEQPTKFELVVNLKTAKALGITVPKSILVRADRVIE